MSNTELQINWIVRNTRTNNIVYGFPTLTEALTEARRMNNDWQTDEYQAQSWDTVK